MKFKKEKLVKVDRVKVKDRFGMKAGTWLTIMYTLIIILIIFFVGFLPDIKNGQKRVTFTSSAGNVSVYSKNTYLGGTPFTTTLKSGDYDLSFKSYGIELDKQEITVGKPVFFAWWFKRHQTVNSTETLAESELNSVENYFLDNLSQKALITEYDNSHFYSPIFNDFATLTKNTSVKTDKNFWSLAFSFISSPEMLSDAKTASDILGLDWDFSIQENIFNKKDYSSKNNKPITNIEKNYATTQVQFPTFRIDGLVVEAGTYILGNNTSNTYPEIVEQAREISVNTFNIAQSEVTQYQWALFMQANPNWSKDNLDSLMEAELVDDQYLAGISPSLLFPSNKPITNISYKAAQAFCKWLSQESDKDFFIPSEAQWEVAGLETGSNNFQNEFFSATLSEGLHAFLGGVWEFTSTPFIPLARVSSFDVVDLYYSFNHNSDSDIIIKGGSYLSIADQISSSTVGITARKECSAYTGFRVAWN